MKGSSASAGAPEALPPYTVVPAPIAPATASAPPVSTAAPSAAAAASSAVVSATAAACSAETAAAAVAPVPASAPASSPEMETPRAQQLRQDLQMYKLVREAHPELSHEQAWAMACPRDRDSVAAPSAPPAGPVHETPASMAPPPTFQLRLPPTPQGGRHGPPYVETYEEHHGHGHQGGRQGRDQEGGARRYGQKGRDTEEGTAYSAKNVLGEVTGSSLPPQIAAPPSVAPAPVTVPVVAPVSRHLNPGLPPAVVAAPEHYVPSSTRRAAIRKAYARMDTSVLMPLPSLPFASDHNVSELVQFTSAMRDAASSLRIACDDPHPIKWIRGWDKCLERHVMRAVRSASPQAPALKAMISGAFKQAGRLQDEGLHGPEVLQHVIRTLCRGLSRATPAAVMQALQNLVVPAGTLFSTYLTELHLLVENVRCIGHVAPEDGTMQIAIKTGVDDQFSILNAQIFAGRNLRALPFDSVDELMASLDDLALNQTQATASGRVGDGGMATRSKVYNQAFRSRQFGGVMPVAADPFEDEAEEFSKVYAIMREKGGFGKNNKDPPFYVSFNSREERDAARRRYGNRCLNCREENHFARDCPAKFLNLSGMIHPAVGEGTPDEAEQRWRRWQDRLCQWARVRANRNTRNT